MKVQLNDIRAKETWEGKEPMNHSPGFDYCRKLLKEGVDPKEKLEIYRGEELAYSMNVGYGAKRRIIEDKNEGPRIVEYNPSPPMSEKDKARLALNRATKAERSTVDTFKI